MTFLKKITQALVLLSLLTAVNTTAYANRGRYDRETEENYKRYKSYAAPKQKELSNKWDKFKKESNWDDLSPAERRRLKDRVMRKSR